MRRARPEYRIAFGCGHSEHQRAVCPTCGLAVGTWETIDLHYNYPGFQHPCNPEQEEQEWLTEPDLGLGF